MGGGSGISREGLGNTEELEKKAKEELQRGERRNTFLSFDYDDIDEVNLLRAQAKNEKSDVEFIDRSVKEPFDSERVEYIKHKILERIRQCSQTVVYLGEKTSDSKWVKWEIEKSLEMGKKVIAVHKGDTAPTTLPQEIREKKVKVIPWSKLAENL